VSATKLPPVIDCLTDGPGLSELTLAAEGTELAAATSANQETQYAYRRTKHGFEKCYNRNRFGSQRWRRLFSSVPYC
jgi:hypothetical protein